MCAIGSTHRKEAELPYSKLPAAEQRWRRATIIEKLDRNMALDKEDKEIIALALRAADIAED